MKITAHKKWGLTLMYCPAGYFDKQSYLMICFIYGMFYIYLPWKRDYYKCDPPQYGMYLYGERRIDSAWFCNGKKIKCYYLPWYYDWIRTSVKRHDGSWETERCGSRKEFWNDKWKDILWSESHPYKYSLKNGDVQNVIATIRLEQREWRWKWFKWCKVFRMIRTTIDVSFNHEVGEESGSWKGGVLGCGYNIKKNESPLECLRRMEKERKF